MVRNNIYHGDLFNLDHPIDIFQSKFSLIDKRSIGRVGAERADKVICTAVDFVKKINEIKFEKFHILNIGKSEANKEFLGVDDYRSKLKSVDIFLFLYKNDGCQCTASGALLDAIATGRSVYTTRFIYAEYIKPYFQNLHIFNDVDDLIDNFSADAPIFSDEVKNSVCLWNEKIANDIKKIFI